MTYREKVIRELERIRDYDPMIRVSHDDVFKGYAEDALALLKAQEPIEPIYGLGIARCRCCNREIDKYDGVKYCPSCGQAVKWDE